MANINKLVTELQSDPGTYAPLTNAQVADLLNTIDQPRNRTSMTGREVASHVLDTEYGALSEAKKDQFLSLISADDLDPFGLGANVVKDVFGTSSSTVTALVTARVETVSLADILGIGFLYPLDVRVARGAL